MTNILKLLVLLLPFGIAALGGRAQAAPVDPESLPEVGYHPGGLAYWSDPYFANAFDQGGGWLEFAPNQWGSTVLAWNNPQFNAAGYPQYLNPGLRLRGMLWGLHTDYGSARPATWPDRSRLGEGRVTLTWQGEADIRLSHGAFVAAASSGAATGMLVNGRRVYTFGPGAQPQDFVVEAINPANPITEIKVWLPDPVNPTMQSLEGHLFHPTFLARLADAEWGYIRFMDWGVTNASPVQEWADRRLPSQYAQNGVLNTRSPGGGHAGNRPTGVAYEHMVALANTADKDMWICIPHLATEDFVRKLARLIRHGSDGVEPYAAPQASPIFAPLEPGRRVFIEYSNEIWSNGSSFAQGDWAQQQATAPGISKARFNARRFCDVWRLFEEEFAGETGRLVRVAATFTAQDFYTNEFLDEMRVYGPTLVPPQEPDVIACTTYFGNGIQDYVYDRARAAAGTSTPWFMTPQTFDAGGGNMRPVTLPANDPYWVGAAFAAHQNEAFDEWERRLLTGDAREGAGPDAVGIGGGFPESLATMARTTFATAKPIIAYEGGPSVYTDDRDWADSRDDGITIFMEAMNRHPRMADVYRIHLNQAKKNGLASHTAFVDVSAWGKYGQWGHLEYLDQDPQASVKWRFLLDWIAEFATIRSIYAPLNGVPQFTTPHMLPIQTVGSPYEAFIEATGGDGALRMTLVGSRMLSGLTVEVDPGNPSRGVIRGSATGDGNSYAMFRVVDADGDPQWRTFTLKSVGGPGVLLESDFRGTNPAQTNPWPAAYYIHPALAQSGWARGAGIIPAAGDGAYTWSVNAPADEANSTLALAIVDQEHLALTVTPQAGQTMNLAGAEVRCTIRRVDWHAPRRYAFFTSIAGFDATAAVHTTPRSQDTADQEVSFLLPNEPAYNGLSGPFQFRIVGFAGQYGGHKTSIVGFRLGGQVRSAIAVSEAWGMY